MEDEKQCKQSCFIEPLYWRLVHNDPTFDTEEIPLWSEATDFIRLPALDEKCSSKGSYKVTSEVYYDEFSSDAEFLLASPIIAAIAEDKTARDRGKAFLVDHGCDLRVRSALCAG